MRSKIMGALVAFAIVSGLVKAANITITFSAGQNTYTQQTLIPLENTRKCAEHGLSPGCSSANLVTAGCVAAPFSAVTKTNLAYRDCLIYAQNSTGETAYNSDKLYRVLLSQVQVDLDTDVQASCAAFKAASLAIQQGVCQDIGRPNDCRVCQ